MSPLWSRPASLLLALSAVAASIGPLAFASRFWPADDAASSVILLIGLAVRVDYSLFYIAARAHTNNAGLTALPPNLEIAKTSERIQEAFPGGPQPAYVVAEAPDVGAAPARVAVEELRRRALASASSAIRSGWTSTTTASSSPSASRSPVPAQARGPSAPLALLRKRLVPETVDRVPGVEVGIDGLTAESKDFTDLLGRRAPLLFAFVFGLAFLLLMAAFRSTVVAAKAVRSVLVPAAMKLLGRWNWYPPRWLEKLPRPSHAPVSGERRVLRRLSGLRRGPGQSGRT